MIVEPPITVITVVWNAVNTLEKCIQSVIDQQVDNIEYIVIDGGSTDGTLEVIKKYSGFISKIVSEPDKGLYDAMNKGLLLATGKYIHFLNADDHYFSPDVLSTLLPKLDSESVCYGQMIYVEENGNQRTLGTPFSWDAELKKSHIPQPALFVPKKLYVQVEGFDLSLAVAADYDMILRLAKRFPVKYIPMPTTVMHAGGISYQRTHVTFREAMKVSQRYGRPFISAWLTYIYRIFYWRLLKLLPSPCISLLRRLAGR